MVDWHKNSTKLKKIQSYLFIFQVLLIKRINKPQEFCASQINFKNELKRKVRLFNPNVLSLVAQKQVKLQLKTRFSVTSRAEFFPVPEYRLSTASFGLSGTSLGLFGGSQLLRRKLSGDFTTKAAADDANGYEIEVSDGLELCQFSLIWNLRKVKEKKREENSTIHN